MSVNDNVNTILLKTQLKSLNDFEIAVSKFPKLLHRELKHVFPNLDPSNMSAIFTLQKSKFDLVDIGPEIDVEKDRLLEQFFEYAKSLVSLFESSGFWADYIDPCSALPMITPECNKTYNEVECMEIVLNFKTVNCGCCKVLLHPTWGSYLYPASIVTNAPSEVILEVLEKSGSI